ncbi:hypothetical protein [Gemmatimonas sp.]
MPHLLSRIPRLLERVALFGFVSFVLMLAAGSAREPRAFEGGAEETVHAAREYAVALALAPVGAGDDDRDTPDAIENVAARRVVLPPTSASGVQALRTNAPSSPARFLPAARAPPILG